MQFVQDVVRPVRAEPAAPLEGAQGVVDTEEDIDTAMRLGVNYPLGPFEWSRRLGVNWSYDVLDELHVRDPSGRYAPSLALYRHAYANEKREGTQ